MKVDNLPISLTSEGRKLFLNALYRMRGQKAPLLYETFEGFSESIPWTPSGGWSEARNGVGSWAIVVDKGTKTLRFSSVTVNDNSLRKGDTNWGNIRCAAWVLYGGTGWVGLERVANDGSSYQVHV